MQTYILYGKKNAYKVTSADNYHAYIQNARAILNFDDFSSVEEVLDYIEKYTNISRANIQILAKESEAV